MPAPVAAYRFVAEIALGPVEGSGEAADGVGVGVGVGWVGVGVGGGIGGGVGAVELEECWPETGVRAVADAPAADATIRWSAAGISCRAPIVTTAIAARSPATTQGTRGTARCWWACRRRPIRSRRGSGRD